MWRTVQVNGQIKGWKEIDDIITYLTVDKQSYDSPAYEDGVFFLQFGSGVFGLNKWVEDDGRINAVGNVYERDCTIEDLEKELKIIANKFPKLIMELHAGDDYESKHCVYSFNVFDGIVEKVEPHIRMLDDVDDSKIMKNFINQLRGK